MNTNETKRSRIWLVAVFAVLFCLPNAAFAQGNFTASELDTLVANIALYPDPLLVQVLAASTHGDDIHPAAVWAEAHKNMTGKDLSAALERAKLPYDPSVQALIPFPQVLSMMDRYPAWTEQLGDAVFMQKEDVMASVQRLRRTASKFGHLRSDDRVKVTNGDNITITPVRTEYVYVPVYNPYYVYYRYYDGYARITYAPGIWIGGWFGFWDGVPAGLTGTGAISMCVILAGTRRAGISRVVTTMRRLRVLITIARVTMRRLRAGISMTVRDSGIILLLRPVRRILLRPRGRM